MTEIEYLFEDMNRYILLLRACDNVKKQELLDKQQKVIDEIKRINKET